MSLINCEINYILAWSANCFIIAGAIANEVPIFAITLTKHYVPITNLSTQDNAKLLKQLKTFFKEQLT